MFIDFRKRENYLETIIFKKKEIERVETFTYLGIFLYNKHMWKNTNCKI